jgi:hypothetical protein
MQIKKLKNKKKMERKVYKKKRYKILGNQGIKLI